MFRATCKDGRCIINKPKPKQNKELQTNPLAQKKKTTNGNKHKIQDMRVRLWSPKMEAGATFDMSAFGPCPIVHSLCLSSDGTKLLVGVKGCEVCTTE